MQDDTKGPEARSIRLDRTLLVATFAGVVLAAGALALDPAFAASDDPGAADMAPDFAALDTDSDGTLTEKEWMDSSPASTMNGEMAAAHYRMYDVDEDGSVTPDEYAKVNEEALGGMKDEAI